MKKLLNWFYNLKTSVKLISAFLILALFQVGTGVIALSQMGALNNGISGMFNNNLKPIQEVAEARDLVQQLRLASRDLYLAQTEQETEKLIADVKKIREKIEAHVSAYSKHQLSYEQEDKINRFNNIWEAHNNLYDRAVQLVIDGKNTEYLLSLNGGLLNTQNGMINELDALMELDAAAAEKAQQKAQKVYLTTLMVVAGITAFICLLSILFGIFIAKVISRPLGQVARLVEKVADGDLSETVNIRTKDEVGTLARSVNKMVGNLRATIQNILSASENLSASAEQVSASTEEIASASTNQANAAQTINELFKELADAINSVAQNTEQAAELSNKTIKIAKEGGQVVQSSVEGAAMVSTQMSRLEEDSKKIGEIIEVINDIADQTNLLALNAAIEAARAGEQGRGFAVVADEVRKLAERSSQATNEISNIIKNMQEATVVSVKSVEEGVTTTQKSGEAFENIIQMINDTGNKVTEIASASEEQAAQTSEVLSYIESISATTEEAAASSEETASTANALTELAEELNASVSAFKLSKEV
ncbi:methyl-accepting chemotaxis protein [Siminovitchia sp. 179-K 8D1 HS]|uniref:methyl-accepting chemotaxis protein n=1 Tax=Siminovitchia sp. 179-K 8D1 HS TaxID=3142385 RepID=UPI0039A2BA99